jgi:hypothetical protein
MWRVLAGSGAALSLLVGGCIIFTGGTGGYSAALLEVGASCTASSQCASTACCYSLDAGAPSAACATSCASAFEQACTPDGGECGEGGTCLPQSCTGTVSGYTATVSVQTCGAIPTCTDQ